MEHRMQFRLTNSALAIGLLLTWLAVDAPAESPSPTAGAKDLWSLLRLPTVANRPQAKTIKQQVQAAVAKAQENQIIEPADSDPKPTKKPAKIDDSTFSSQFSATSSNRRSAIVKQAAQAATEEPVRQQETEPKQLTAVTPHWTPKFVEQAAFVMCDDELARPVAVNMAGELLSERVTPTKAVIRMDATLSVVPPATKETRTASENPTQAPSASEHTQARSASEGTGSRRPSTSEKPANSPTEAKTASGRPISNSKLATSATPTAAH
jgi:hypothetical protein